jgi:hypothetical protein
MGLLSHFVDDNLAISEEGYGSILTPMLVSIYLLYIMNIVEIPQNRAADLLQTDVLDRCFCIKDVLIQSKCLPASLYITNHKVYIGITHAHCGDF